MQNMSSFDVAYAEAEVAGVVNTQSAARERHGGLREQDRASIKPA